MGGTFGLGTLIGTRGFGGGDFAELFLGDSGSRTRLLALISIHLVISIVLRCLLYDPMLLLSRSIWCILFASLDYRNELSVREKLYRCESYFSWFQVDIYFLIFKK